MAHNRGGRSRSSRSEENVSKDTAKNMFVNDGSFLERFRKQMESMEKESNAKKPHQGEAKQTTVEEGRTSNKQDEQEANENQKPERTSSSLSLQGKRTISTGKMGGAGRQMNAKKKKEEKAVAAKQDEEEKKPTAWNAYMEEVKRYREMTCSEDVDRVRPLVK